MASMMAKSSLKVMLLLAVAVAASALSVTNTSPSTTIVVNTVRILPNTTANIGPLPLTGLLNVAALGRSAIVVVPPLTQAISITANTLFGIAYGALNSIIGVIPVPV